MALKKRPQNIDEYIQSYPSNVQDRLQKMRLTIAKAAPDAKETISYSMPAFRQDGILVWFAGFKNHVGFYPGASGIAHFKTELSRFKNAKGSVQFPHDRRLPLALVGRIVRYRVSEQKKRTEQEVIQTSKKSVRRKQSGIRVFFGDIRKMTGGQVVDGEVALVVTSPPYYNAPFDYPGLFSSYSEYLDLVRSLAIQCKRVLAEGRICAIVTDDMLVSSGKGGRGKKYPIVADTTRIFLETGFQYRDRIVWVKPAGYTRISRRSGVVLQHPYPMYFYTDNIQESILLFQNGTFDYQSLKKMPSRVLAASRIDTSRMNREYWNRSVWNITNVLPRTGRVEEGVAAFPDEIPRRLIQLFTFAGETVFDPFAGSGTTLKVAQELGRKAIGYEIDLDLKNVIRRKLGRASLEDSTGYDSKETEGAGHLRKRLQARVRKTVAAS